MTRTAAVRARSLTLLANRPRLRAAAARHQRPAGAPAGRREPRRDVPSARRGAGRAGMDRLRGARRQPATDGCAAAAATHLDVATASSFTNGRSRTAAASSRGDRDASRVSRAQPVDTAGPIRLEGPDR